MHFPIHPSLHPSPPPLKNNPPPSLSSSVRPARLPNLRDSEGGVFSWDYPDSWEKPCSFFGLLFQVKVVRHGDSCDAREHIKVIVFTRTFACRTCGVRFKRNSAVATHRTLCLSGVVLLALFVLGSSTPQRKPHMRSTSKTGGIFSACGHKTSTQRDRGATGANMCEYIYPIAKSSNNSGWFCE